MIVLDSNVLSALMRDPPEPLVETWLDQQPQASVWTTAITVFELRFGLELLAHGSRRRKLEQMLELVLGRFEERIAALDQEAAARTAEYMAACQKRGRRWDIRDGMIAGVVIARNASLATRNTSHFEDAGIPLINPWKA